MPKAEKEERMKKVNLVITVPDNKYCWDGNEICGHFDNEGGHASCSMGFWQQTQDKHGYYLKDKKCLILSVQL